MRISRRAAAASAAVFTGLASLGAAGAAFASSPAPCAALYLDKRDGLIGDPDPCWDWARSGRRWPLLGVRACSAWLARGSWSGACQDVLRNGDQLIGSGETGSCPAQRVVRFGGCVLLRFLAI